MSSTSPQPADLGTDAQLPDFDRLRARVRGDQRATSSPMLVFGALIVLYAAIIGLYSGRLEPGGRHLALLLYWPVATAIGLLTLRWSARRRAARDGVGEGRHPYRTAVRAYAVALVLIVVLFLPVLFIGVFTPLVWPAAVLGALAAWQRDRLLGGWAIGIGVLGGAESWYVLAHRDLGAPWWWLQPVLHGALGLALVAAGLVVARRERAAG